MGGHGQCRRLRTCLSHRLFSISSACQSLSVFCSLLLAPPGCCSLEAIMAKRKAPSSTTGTPATTKAATASSSGTLLNFFRPSSAQADNQPAPALKPSLSEDSGKFKAYFSGSVASKSKRKASVPVTVLGTSAANAVIIDDSSDDEADLRAASPVKKPRLSGPETPTAKTEVIDLNDDPTPLSHNLPSTSSAIRPSATFRGTDFDDSNSIDLDDDATVDEFFDPEADLVDQEEALEGELVDDPDATLGGTTEEDAFASGSGEGGCPICSLPFEDGEDVRSICSLLLHRAFH